jgi:hypothetical protein
MNDSKEPKDQEKKPQGGDETKKDLDDILGKIKESDGKGTGEKAKLDDGEELIQKMHAKGKESEDESEGLEQILDSISEKEEVVPTGEMNFLQRFFGIFTSPGKVFDYLKVKPDYLIPLVIALLISVLSSYLFYDIAITDQIDRIEQNDNIPAERKDAIIDQMESGKEGTQRMVSTFVIAPVAVLVIYLLVSAIFLFIGSVLLGGKAKYKQILSVYSYSYLIVIFLSTLIKTPLILAKRTTKIQMSPAVFLDADQISTALYNFIGSFDIFVVWFLVVFALGFSTIYGFSKLKGVVSVFIAWLLYVLIVNVVLAGLFQSFTG